MSSALGGRLRTRLAATLLNVVALTAVAQALGKPTADAARVAVTRALERLIQEMDYER